MLGRILRRNLVYNRILRPLASDTTVFRGSLGDVLHKEGKAG